MIISVVIHTNPANIGTFISSDALLEAMKTSILSTLEQGKYTDAVIFQDADGAGSLGGISVITEPNDFQFLEECREMLGFQENPDPLHENILAQNPIFKGAAEESTEGEENSISAQNLEQTASPPEEPRTPKTFSTQNKPMGIIYENVRREDLQALLPDVMND